MSSSLFQWQHVNLKRLNNEQGTPTRPTFFYSFPKNNLGVFLSPEYVQSRIANFAAEEGRQEAFSERAEKQHKECSGREGPEALLLLSLPAAAGTPI